MSENLSHDPKDCGVCSPNLTKHTGLLLAKCHFCGQWVCSDCGAFVHADECRTEEQTP